MHGFVSIVPIEHENGLFHTVINGINMDMKLEQKVAT